MRPIVGNKSIEAIEKALFKPAALPFPAQNMDDIGRLSQTELEGHLTQVSHYSPFFSIFVFLLFFISLSIVRHLYVFSFLLSQSNSHSPSYSYPLFSPCSTRYQYVTTHTHTLRHIYIYMNTQKQTHLHTSKQIRSAFRVQFLYLFILAT